MWGNQLLLLRSTLRRSSTPRPSRLSSTSRCTRGPGLFLGPLNRNWRFSSVFPHSVSRRLPHAFRPASLLGTCRASPRSTHTLTASLNYSHVGSKPVRSAWRAKNSHCNFDPQGAAHEASGNDQGTPSPFRMQPTMASMRPSARHVAQQQLPGNTTAAALVDP